jgi:hypothetical protein
MYIRDQREQGRIANDENNNNIEQPRDHGKTPCINLLQSKDASRTSTTRFVHHHHHLDESFFPVESHKPAANAARGHMPVSGA